MIVKFEALRARASLKMSAPLLSVESSPPLLLAQPCSSSKDSITRWQWESCFDPLRSPLSWGLAGHLSFPFLSVRSPERPYIFALAPRTCSLGSLFLTFNVPSSRSEAKRRTSSVLRLRP